MARAGSPVVGEGNSGGNGGGGTPTAPDRLIPSGYKYQTNAQGELELIQTAGTGAALTDTVIARQSIDGMFHATSIRTGVSSFHLGDVHSFGSAGENVVFHNENTDVVWWPVWQGYHAGSDTRYGATFRKLGAHAMVPIGTEGAGTTPYTTTVIPQANSMFVRVTLKAGENYTGRLKWKGWYSGGGKTILEKVKSVAVVVGDEITFTFPNPLFAYKNQSIDVAAYKADGSLFLAKAQVEDANQPYRVVEYCPFEDVPVVTEPGADAGYFSAAGTRTLAGKTCIACWLQPLRFQLTEIS